MKRTVHHIYNLTPAEVVLAFRWYLMYRELRMPDDDKSCEVMIGHDSGAQITFVEEIEDHMPAPGELKWTEPRKPINNVSTDGI